MARGSGELGRLVVLAWLRCQGAWSPLQEKSKLALCSSKRAQRDTPEGRELGRDCEPSSSQSAPRPPLASPSPLHPPVPETLPRARQAGLGARGPGVKPLSSPVRG